MIKDFSVGIQLLEGDLIFKNVEKVFSRAWELLPFTHIMISTQNSHLLDACVKEARRRGIKIYVWKQIFHKIGSEYKELGQLVGLNSEPIQKSWICPNNMESAESIIEELRFILNNNDVDGLFIDVFRYPSPYDGLSSMLTCFCKPCISRALEMGIDLEKTRKGVKDFIERIRRLSMEEIALLKKEGDRSKIFHHLFRDPDMLNFFKFRSYSINNFVKNVHLLVKEKGLSLGLDIFPPSLSWLVGQDYSLLKNNCSWMKPMIYCSGLGPACMPAEILSLVKELQKLNPRLSDKDAIYMISRFLELPLPYKNMDEIRVKGLPEEFVRLETARAKESVGKNVPTYAGIEAVVTDVCSISPERAESYVKKAIEGGADGIVLSWNIQLIPNENLKVIRKAITSNIGD
ncbi:MAG: hypothetical protein QXF52_05965 [Thermoproteota archaeon]